MYYVEVYAWKKGDNNETYLFRDFSDALQSFRTTYSKCGPIGMEPYDTGTAVTVLYGDCQRIVGIITPMDKMFVYDRPTHF